MASVNSLLFWLCSLFIICIVCSYESEQGTNEEKDKSVAGTWSNTRFGRIASVLSTAIDQAHAMKDLLPTPVAGAVAIAAQLRDSYQTGGLQGTQATLSSLHAENAIGNLIGPNGVDLRNVLSDDVLNAGLAVATGKSDWKDAITKLPALASKNSVMSNSMLRAALEIGERTAKGALVTNSASEAETNLKSKTKMISRDSDEESSQADESDSIDSDREESHTSRHSHRRSSQRDSSDSDRDSSRRSSKRYSEKKGSSKSKRASSDIQEVTEEQVRPRRKSRKQDRVEKSPNRNTKGTTPKQVKDGSEESKERSYKKTEDEEELSQEQLRSIQYESRASKSDSLLDQFGVKASAQQSDDDFELRSNSKPRKKKKNGHSNSGQTKKYGAYITEEPEFLKYLER